MSEETNFDVLNGKLDKILGLLSERSKEVITKEMGGEKEMGYEVATTSIVKGQHPSPTNSKPPEPFKDVKEFAKKCQEDIEAFRKETEARSK